MNINFLDDVYVPETDTLTDTQQEEATDTCTTIPSDNAQESNSESKSGTLSTILLIAGALLLCLAIALIYKKKKK